MQKPREKPDKQSRMQKISEDLWMAAKEPPPGTVLPELQASREAKRKEIDKNLACVEVVGKMFVLYENLLSENARSK